MRILDPTDIGKLGVAAHRNQPDGNQTNRGTVFTRCWSGKAAAIVTPNMVLPLRIQREPDAAGTEDEAVPYGFAITIAMPGQIQLYEEIRARIRLQPVLP